MFYYMQHIDYNDQLLEKVKTLTEQCKEAENRADDFERELKASLHKYDQLEGSDI